ncbi:non-structural protein [Bombyx mori cypovirus 1]|uniref:Non-structural protein n=1 Tax=Bombyx mori cytoplasmic polyhedrosis virus TaxID=110829 RepID=C6K2M9_CPVBM|nr:non-structural protein [Bombyx mori cypovirus 1]
MTTKLFKQTIIPTNKDVDEKYIYFIERADHKIIKPLHPAFEPWQFAGNQHAHQLEQGYADGHRFITNYNATSRLNSAMTLQIMNKPMITIVKKFTTNTPHQVTTIPEGYSFGVVKEKLCTNEQLLSLLALTAEPVIENDGEVNDTIQEDETEKKEVEMRMNWSDEVVELPKQQEENVFVLSKPSMISEEELMPIDMEVMTPKVLEPPTPLPSPIVVAVSSESPQVKEIERLPADLPQEQRVSRKPVARTTKPSFSSFSSPDIVSANVQTPVPKVAPRPVEEFLSSVFTSLFEAWFVRVLPLIKQGKPVYMMPGTIKWEREAQITDTKTRYFNSVSGKLILVEMESITRALQPGELNDRRELIRQTLETVCAGHNIHVLTGKDTFGVLEVE